MGKYWFVVWLFASNFSLQAQVNLVPNPSFEDTVGCPVGHGQIAQAFGWNYSYGTPDYYNSCATHTNNFYNAGVPTNFLGYQMAHSGDAYCGFATYSNVFTNIRETMEAKLTQTLVIGQKYFVRFFISCTSKKDSQNYFALSNNKIGMKLTKDSFSQNNCCVPIDNISQVYTDSIITDTVNWTKVFGSFVADSAYKYIHFGNFFDDSLVSSILLDTLGWLAYYYIDDIILSTDSAFAYVFQSDLKKNDIEIFPNPVINSLKIITSQFTKYELCSVEGKQITKGKLETIGVNEIYFRDLENGIYILTLSNNVWNSISKKIIKIKN